MAEMMAARDAFGKALVDLGKVDPRVVVLDADLGVSTKASMFQGAYPDRFFQIGIAEQNMMSVAAGLAREGFIPVTGTYGVFASGRAWDQIRTTICYSNLNVKIAGAHGGISVGADGATHQALEEIALTSILPNMHVVVPCDSVETQKATEYSLLKLQGPCYLRFAREATPIVTKPDTPYEFGVANVIRYRGVQPKFLDAFETFLGPAYKNEHENVSIIACGPMVPEAMRAAWLLKEEYAIETRGVNVHTVKPLDSATLEECCTGGAPVFTIEEHGPAGGLGSALGEWLVARQIPCRLISITTREQFAHRSGSQSFLRAEEGLSGQQIAERILTTMERCFADR